jgi:8-oxo-dGTP pyrophosphatase MutT (NUDIX family)
MPADREQRVVVAAVVVDGHSVLILQRSDSETVLPGRWELPSGKKEFGETCQEALHREALEETALSIDLHGPCHVFDYVVEGSELVRETTQISFLASIVGGSAAIGPDHQRLAWVTLDQLDDYDLSAETKAAIRAGLLAERVPRARPAG